MMYLQRLINYIQEDPLLSIGFNIILLVAAWIVVHILCKFFVIRIVRRVFFSSQHQDIPLEKDRRIAEKLSNFVPVLTVYYLLQFMPDMPTPWITAIHTLCGILFFIYLSVFFNELLDIINISYVRKAKRKNHSIKGYIQIGKILIHIIAAIMILAVMSNKSPVIIISSLGAAAAVLMLVFQHTLLSLVANVQLSSNDVLQLGDWIEMPDKNLSGEVIDIALHTITIRNWDNTISRIPTKNFLTETYTNWQAMFSSGSRRIMRSIFLDQHSVVFLTQQNLKPVLGLRGVSEPLSQLVDGRDPTGIADSWFIENGLTNLTLFRHYLMAYLAEREDIVKDMYIMVRTLKPSPAGLPLEVYCFTSSTLWMGYENTQSAIFEYIMAISEQFSLRLYQYPAGHYFRHPSTEGNMVMPPPGT